MATAEQVKALIRCHAEGDEDRFYAVALQVAAQAARSGHSKFAQELKSLIDRAKGKRPQPGGLRTRPIPVVQPRGELAALFTAMYPDSRLSDMSLDESIRSRIERVLIEQRQRDRIRSHGLSPVRKLLLVGPPGTGKTLTAGVLAGELGLALFAIQFDALITKFLGETAAKLRVIFDSIQETRAVYLFDEFDALGAERAAKNEVGEIRRVLNSFLQFIERDASDSVIVCATNHPQLLDRALFRRFDSVLEYGLPSATVAESILRGRLGFLDTSEIQWDAVVQSAAGLNHAELVRACEHAAKNAILAHRTKVQSGELIEAIKERGAAQL